MLGRIYTVVFEATAVTVAADLWEIVPADDKPCRIHSFYLGQTPELQDAADEKIELEITRGGTAITTGSGGSAPTPIPVGSSANAAAGFTAEVLNTTQATFTGGVALFRDVWNIHQGYAYRPTPEERFGVSQTNGGLTIRLGAAPADSITIAGTLFVEELG
jgi:hypothetical protein